MADFYTMKFWNCCKVPRAHDVVGLDLVEVAPDYDPAGSTAILAAQLLLNTLGFVFHARMARARMARE